MALRHVILLCAGMLSACASSGVDIAATTPRQRLVVAETSWHATLVTIAGNQTLIPSNIRGQVSLAIIATEAALHNWVQHPDDETLAGAGEASILKVASLIGN